MYGKSIRTILILSAIALVAAAAMVIGRDGQDHSSHPAVSAEEPGKKDEPLAAPKNHLPSPPLVAEFGPFDRRISFITFFHDGDALRLRKGIKNEDLVIDVKTGAPVKVFTIPDKTSGFVYSADGETVAALHREKVSIWHIPTNKQVTQLRKAWADRVVAISPNGEMLAIDNHEGYIRVVETDSKRTIKKLRTRTGGDAQSVVFSPDGEHLAWGSGSFLELWRVRDKQQQQLKRSHYLWSVEFIHGGKTIATEGNGGATLRDLESKRLIAELNTGGKGYRGAVSPDGKLYAVLDRGSKSIEIWEMATRRKVAALPGAKGTGCFSPSSAIFAAPRGDGIGLWDVANISKSAPAVRGPDGQPTRPAVRADRHVALPEEVVRRRTAARLLAKANEARGDGEQQVAVEIYRKIIAEYVDTPSLVKTHSAMASYHAGERQFKLAIEYYNKVIRATGGNERHSAAMGAAYCYRMIGDDLAAADHYDMAGRSYTSWCGTGLAEIKQSYYDQATKLRQHHPIKAFEPPAQFVHDMNHFVGLSEDAAASTLDRLADVRHLYAGRYSLTDDALEVLSNSDKLIELVVSGRGITNAGMKTISGMDQLEILKVRDTPIDNDGISEITKLKKLRTVGLNSTKTTSDALRYLESLPQLEEVDWRFSSDDEIGDKTKFLAELKNLRTLKMSGGLSTDSVVQLRKLTSLTHLRLYGGFDDEGVLALAGLTNLETLRLSSEFMSSASLAVLHRMDQLKILDVYARHITDEAVEHLLHLKNLEELHIGRTQFSADAIRKLHVLPKLKRIWAPRKVPKDEQKQLREQMSQVRFSF